MNKFLRTLWITCSNTLLPAIALILAGCSSGSDSGGSGMSINKINALSKLSQEHKQNFENWKNSVVKSCDASEAFGLNTKNRLSQTGVDKAALAKSNGGSPVFTDGQQFLVLTSYKSFSGSSTSFAENSSQVNNAGYSIKSETKREGSNCTVFLSGQKVYETKIFESFEVGISWSPDKASKATSGTPAVKTFGLSGLGELSQHGFYSLLNQTFKFSPEILSLITKKFGITETLAAQLFKASYSPNLNVAAKISEDASAVWSDTLNGTLIDQISSLEELFDGKPKIVDLELRLPTSQLYALSDEPSVEPEMLRITVQAEISKNSSSFDYSTKAVKLVGTTGPDKIEAIKCLGDRAQVFKQNTPKTKMQIEPSVEKLLSPCEALDNDVNSYGYETGLFKSLIATVFTGLVPAENFQYAGWNEVLLRLASEALTENKDILTELDPNKKTVLIKIVSDHLQTLNDEANQTKNLILYKSTLINMGMSWSLKGLRISNSAIQKIVDAADNSMVPFTASTEKLLSQLSQFPGSLDDQLNFAEDIDQNYKDEASKALRTSQQIGSMTFERDIFNQTIQQKISLQTFKDWSSRLETVRNEVQSFKNLGDYKNQIVDLSLKWLTSGEATAQDLAPIFKGFSNALPTFKASLDTLMQTLRKSLAEGKPSLDFARSISPEYKRLAERIVTLSASAANQNWGQTFINSILQTKPTQSQLVAWNEMWESVISFEERERAKTSDSDTMSKWHLEAVIKKAISENWGNSEFVGFEAIAEVAKGKVVCGNKVSSSSLAECANGSMFSRQKGKFFDPAFNHRYTQLSRDFVTFIKQLESANNTTLKWNLANKYFGTSELIWSGCEQAAFDQKSLELKFQMNALKSESDQIKKWELERQINKTIENCSSK